MEINKFEIRRQIFHICLGLAIVFLLQHNTINSLTLFVVLIIGIITSLLSKKYKIPIIYHFLKIFERKKTIKNFPGRGTISFFIGCLLVAQLFERNIALASMMVLTFGDSISHLVGWHIGRKKHPLNCLKSIEGNVAGAIAGFIGAMFFVSPLYALLASFGAMTAEAVEIKMNERIVDDNITVPLVAGTVMHLLRIYF
jgi:dolichol kinase